MKQRIIVTALAATVLVMSGCSSTKSGDVANGGYVEPGKNAGIAISEQRLATSDFKRQGVKIIYTLSGSVEAIEVTGYAPVWGGSQQAARESYRVAELEAKKSLNDFINKETIASSTSVTMISQNLEHARDQKTNKIASNRSGPVKSDLIATDEEVKSDTATNSNQEENTAERNDALRIASRVNTTITSTNRGILGGLYLLEGKVIDNGKHVQVTLRWDKKHNQSRTQVRNLMAM